MLNSKLLQIFLKAQTLLKTAKENGLSHRFMIQKTHTQGFMIMHEYANYKYANVLLPTQPHPVHSLPWYAMRLSTAKT